MAVLLYQSSQKPVSHPITRLLVTTLAFFKQFLIVKKKKRKEKKTAGRKSKGAMQDFKALFLISGKNKWCRSSFPQDYIPNKAHCRGLKDKTLRSLLLVFKGSWIRPL